MIYKHTRSIRMNLYYVEILFEELSSDIANVVVSAKMMMYAGFELFYLQNIL